MGFAFLICNIASGIARRNILFAGIIVEILARNPSWDLYQLLNEPSIVNLSQQMVRQYSLNLRLFR